MSKLKQLKRRIRSRLGRTYVSKSGKRTKRCGYASMFGQNLFIHIPLNDEGSVDYTVEEVADMAIQCTWCGRPIHIGDIVTLQKARRIDFIPPAYAVVHPTDPPQFIGCTGHRCCDDDTKPQGLWVTGEKGKGKVFLFPEEPGIKDALVTGFLRMP